MNSDGYMLKDVSRLLGINPKTIASYTDKGLVIPEIFNPEGKGSNRVYSKGNLVEFILIKTLSDAGLSIKKIKTITEGLKTHSSRFTHLHVHKHVSWSGGLLERETHTTRSYYRFLILSNIHTSHFRYKLKDADTYEFLSELYDPENVTFMVINITPMIEKVKNL